MTMDVRRRCTETTTSFIVSSSPAGELQPPPGSILVNETGSPPPTKTPTTATSSPVKASTKRSFDVAFLMAPDDSSKRRHHQEELKEQLRLVSANNLLQQYSQPPVEKTRYSEAPLGLLVPSKNDINSDELTKSAFTKVSSPVRIENLPSPNSMSPDLSYGDSLSPNGRSKSPQQFYGRPVPYFTGKPTMRAPYLYSAHPEKIHSPTENASYQNPEQKGGSTSKTIYPAAEVLPYGGLAVAAAATYPFPAAFPPGTTRVPALLTAAAAANVTAALLPSSLAAFTLPAQNVCAKCNISFRMTSDLVYHMRSQHKSDNYLSDSNRRRREQDKLRCPVCNESFRERHHLTRHMTAHQDKDGDKLDDESEPHMTGKSLK